MKFVIGFIFFCLSSVDVSPQKEDIVVSVILKNVIGKSFIFNCKCPKKSNSLKLDINV